jgi:hypothetical protein
VAEPPRKKTTTRSFRVDDSALKTIERDASEAGVSVNTFVNQVFLSYTEFDRYFFKSTRNPLLSDNVGVLLGLLSDESAAEAGRLVGQNVMRSMILAKYGSMSLGSILALVRLFARYGKAYSVYESETGGRTTVTIFHNWGMKGSIYLTQIMATLFGMIELKPKITTTDKAVIIPL